MERQILHIDVNNAFLSWLAVYKLSNGETTDIREQVAVIGGDETRRAGIVLAKSTKAKQCGVITGETLYSARKKCSNLQIYQGNYKAYSEYSNKLYEMLKEYTEKIERFSIDECFLDMTNYLKGESLIAIANEISRRVYKELGFTVNIGVAHNKLLAKMASDFTKPNKIHTLFEEEISNKMWNLPISELFMLGKKTVPKLYNLRIKTIGDLAKADINMLIKKFGKHGRQMWEYANGIDNSEVEYEIALPKGIGKSTTLPIDISDINKMEKILYALTEEITYKLRRYNLLANTVNVQLRTKDFKDSSHQGKLNIATANTKDIYIKAKQLLNQMYEPGILIRLIGVRVDNLVGKDTVQLSIFNDDINKKQEKIEKAVDEIKGKYGYNSITRANKLNLDDIVKL